MVNSSAAEQSAGIGQINGAVAELDQMTQQNAALVEESAAAAESLKGQSRQLADAVATFRLGDSTAGVAAVPARTLAHAAIQQARAPKTVAVGKARKSAPPARPAAAGAPAAAPRQAAAPAPAPRQAAASAAATSGNDADWETF